MIFSKKNYEREMKCMKDDVSDLEQRYWDLWHRHYRLLNYLGLEEKKNEPSIEIVKKRK